MSTNSEQGGGGGEEFENVKKSWRRSKTEEIVVIPFLTVDEVSRIFLVEANNDFKLSSMKTYSPIFLSLSLSLSLSLFRERAQIPSIDEAIATTTTTTTAATIATAVATAAAGDGVALASDNSIFEIEEFPAFHSTKDDEDDDDNGDEIGVWKFLRSVQTKLQLIR